MGKLLLGHYGHFWNLRSVLTPPRLGSLGDSKGGLCPSCSTLFDGKYESKKKFLPWQDSVGVSWRKLEKSLEMPSRRERCRTVGSDFMMWHQIGGLESRQILAVSYCFHTFKCVFSERGKNSLKKVHCFNLGGLSKCCQVER